MTTITTSPTLTLAEARRILRSAGYLNNVAPRLECEARAIVQAAQSIVKYPAIDWDTDDGSDKPFEDDELEHELGHDGVGRVQL